MFDVKEYVSTALKEGKPFVGFLSTVTTYGSPCVTALSFVKGENGAFYCMTDCEFEHSLNVSANQAASLATDSGLSMYGECISLGSVRKETNSYLSELFQKVYPKNWRKYGALANQIFLEFSPTLVKVWRYVDGVPYQGYVDYSRDYESCQAYDLSLTFKAREKEEKRLEKINRVRKPSGPSERKIKADLTQSTNTKASGAPYKPDMRNARRIYRYPISLYMLLYNPANEPSDEELLVLLKDVEDLDKEQNEFISLHFTQGLSMHDTAKKMEKTFYDIEKLSAKIYRTLRKKRPDKIER